MENLIFLSDLAVKHATLESTQRTIPESALTEMLGDIYTYICMYCIVLICKAIDTWCKKIHIELVVA